MAAITPTSLIRESSGSLTMFVAKFAATADATDTWASAIPGIVGWLATATETPGSQTNSGVAASLSGSTFTFTPDEDNQSFNLIVWAQG